MNKTKIKLLGFKKEIDAIAGPGHNPAKPQPTPNKPEPIKSFLSIFLLSIEIKFFAKIGLDFFLNIKCRGANIIIAPTITKINEGSHASNIFKKPNTFCGFTIPEIVKPNPKIIPDSKDINLIIKFQI